MKIRAKKGFNIIIKDLGITLRSEKRDWVDVSKEDYDNSRDIKSFLSFIEVSNKGALKDDLVIEDNDTLATQKAFLREGRVFTNPDDVYVRYDQDDVIDMPTQNVVDNEEIIEKSEVLEQAVAFESEQIVESLETPKDVHKSKNKKQSKNKKLNDAVVKENNTIDITVEK